MYNYTELVDEMKDENNECIICLEKCKENKNHVYCKNCNQQYHKHCFKKWIMKCKEKNRKINNCPYCQCNNVLYQKKQFLCFQYKCVI